ncbi:MFS transporter [Streptomyces bohaiensis]|uniref:MFS transporter n=1 Tax=Streptomyces bohaiensis TaxID=1431344 RepID=UPI003B7A75D0
MRTYGELLRIPGARSSVLGGFLGRLPNGMRILGCLLMVSATTGSYAQAGLVTGVMTVCQAIAAPALGRAADRHGQRRLLPTTLLGHGIGLAALIALAVSEAPLWTLLAAAAVSGFTSLPVGSLVRARWVALLGGSPRLPTAYALESVVDETVFVIGPLLATALAISVHPAAGLVGALVLLTLGTVILTVTAPRTAPERESTAGGRVRAVPRYAGMPLLLAVFVLLGTFFGIIDVSILAFAEVQGVPGLAGLLLALLAVGSLIAGLAWGTVSAWRIGLPGRMLLCATAFTVSALPLPWVDGLLVMAVCMVLCGAAVAPALITASLLIERLLPRARLTEGFAWMSSAIAIGMAAGTATGGRIVDSAGHGPALAVATGAAVVCLMLSLAGHRPLDAACAASPRQPSAHSLPEPAAAALAAVADPADGGTATGDPAGAAGGGEQAAATAAASGGFAARQAGDDATSVVPAATVGTSGTREGVAAGVGAGAAAGAPGRAPDGDGDGRRPDPGPTAAPR